MAEENTAPVENTENLANAAPVIEDDTNLQDQVSEEAVETTEVTEETYAKSGKKSKKHIEEDRKSVV